MHGASATVSQRGVKRTSSRTRIRTSCTVPSCTVPYSALMQVASCCLHILGYICHLQYCSPRQYSWLCTQRQCIYKAGGRA